MRVSPGPAAEAGRVCMACFGWLGGDCMPVHIPYRGVQWRAAVSRNKFEGVPGRFGCWLLSQRGWFRFSSLILVLRTPGKRAFFC